ncbi:MAG: iron-containing alcohol dehydrogenase [Candidatus Marinimicrobia bacterium]|jgi:alcohol dehydrogenase class IV|nr:iron-containing alcohol dehydrogenase [Candidatus Neomarinimicrobiota bacterium]
MKEKNGKVYNIDKKKKTYDKMNFTLDHPVRVEFGNGKSNELAKFCGLYGKKVFIVTMQELETLGLLDNAKYGFERESIEYTLFSDVKPEPKKNDFNDAVELIRKGGYDVIVGFGGGSCIDFAKALAICATHENDAWSYVNLSSKPPDTIYPQKVLPVIAVPTTSGTGSEVTPYAVIINPDTIQEGTIKDPSIYPKIAIVDPELMLGLPKKWTAITGIDAFSHSLESYFNKTNRTSFSDMICIEGMKWIVKSLPKAYQDGSNLQARAGVAYGATLGGIAISLAGTTVGHALVHPTDARIGTPHGISVSIYMLSVLRHTLPVDIDRFSKIVRIINPSIDHNQNGFIEKGLQSIESFISQFDFPRKLSDYGVSEEMIDVIVDDTISYMFRPLNQHVKKFTRGELRQIVIESY